MNQTVQAGLLVLGLFIMGCGPSNKSKDMPEPNKNEASSLTITPLLSRAGAGLC